MGTVALSAQAPVPSQQKISVLPPDPALPNVLVIGDSISLGYTPPLSADLKGTANVFHVPDNANDSAWILKYLDPWLQAVGQPHYKVILFNSGLHDFERLVANKLNTAGSIVIPLAEYKANLEKIILRLQPHADTLVWVNTTVVPEGSAGRRPEDGRAYNDAAAAIMAAHHIQIIDIYSLSKEDRAAYGLAPTNVHYKPEGYKRFADKIAGAIAPDLQ
jgi:lysophospholipase L1-like esterase